MQEMQGVITCTYVRILKLDSAEKITKKLASGIRWHCCLDVDNKVIKHKFARIELKNKS